MCNIAQSFARTIYLLSGHLLIEIQLCFINNVRTSFKNVDLYDHYIVIASP